MPDPKKSARTEQELLVRQAIDNPFRLFTAEELRVIVGKSMNFMTAAKKAGAPFPGGTTRPEWFLDWLRVNPTFRVKAA